MRQFSSPEQGSILQAYQEIPEKWYEQRSPRTLFHRILTIPSVVGYATLFASGHDSLKYHLIGMGIFIASEVVDSISTIRVFNATNKATVNDIMVIHYEENPLLQNINSARELIFSPKALLVDLIGAAVSFSFPNLACTYSALKSLSALSNIRVARRYDRAVQIASNQSP